MRKEMKSYVKKRSVDLRQLPTSGRRRHDTDEDFEFGVHKIDRNRNQKWESNRVR